MMTRDAKPVQKYSRGEIGERDRSKTTIRSVDSDKLRNPRANRSIIESLSGSARRIDDSHQQQSSSDLSRL